MLSFVVGCLAVASNVGASDGVCCGLNIEKGAVSGVGHTFSSRVCTVRCCAAASPCLRVVLQFQLLPLLDWGGNRVQWVVGCVRWWDGTFERALARLPASVFCRAGTCA